MSAPITPDVPYTPRPDRPEAKPAEGHAEPGIPKWISGAWLEHPAQTLPGMPDGLYFIHGLDADGLENFRRQYPDADVPGLLPLLEDSGYKVEFIKANENGVCSAPPRQAPAGQTYLEITDDPLSMRTLLQEMIDALREAQARNTSREVALAITKLQEARYWLGESQFGGK